MSLRSAPSTVLVPVLALALACGDAEAVTTPHLPGATPPPVSEPGVGVPGVPLAARDTVVITDTIVIVDTVLVAAGPSAEEVDSLVSRRIDDLLARDPIRFAGGIGWGGGEVVTTSAGLLDPLSDEQIAAVAAAAQTRLLQGDSLRLPGSLGWGGGPPIGSSAHLVASLPNGSWGIGTSNPRGRLDVMQGEIWTSDGPFTMRTSGRLIGENPAGVGLYLDRRSGIGDLPLAVNFQQSGFNRWGVGMDEDSNDTDPDFISVFESEVGDIFRFRAGGRAILGKGVGRPEREHILTITDRENDYIENVLNLTTAGTGSATRFIRAFDRTAVRFAVTTDGRVGVGMDAVFDIALSVNGRTRATSYETISDARLKTEIRDWSLPGRSQVLSLRPVRFAWAEGAPEPGLEDVGLLAQDVRRVLPDLVHEDETGRLSVDYTKLSVVLVDVLREQDREISDLAGRLDRLESGSGLLGGGGPMLVLLAVGAAFGVGRRRRP